MQNNQNNPHGNQSGNGGDKPQQPLSWSQPTAGQQGQTKSAAPAEAKTAQTAEAQGQNKNPNVKISDAKIVNGGAAASKAGASTGSRMALIFVIGLVIGWLVTWSWYDLHSNTRSGLSSNATTTSETGGDTTALDNQSAGAATSTAGAASSSAAHNSSSAASAAQAPQGEPSSDTVTVPVLQDAGMSVSVTQLEANAPVWAAVYEDNNGTPGRVLGAARFHPGQKSGTISLLRMTLPNLYYFVGLLADTPNHTFDIKANAPLLGTDGKQIMTRFEAK